MNPGTAAELNEVIVVLPDDPGRLGRSVQPADSDLNIPLTPKQLLASPPQPRSIMG